MLSDQSLQRLSGALCLASMAVCVLLLFRLIRFSMVFAFPIQAGIVFTAWIVILSHWNSAYRWNGQVPHVLRIALPIVALAGIGITVYGFAGALPDVTPSGQLAHHLNAYFEHGKCLAVFNNDPAIVMPSNFCENFSLHFAAAFCGLWLFFSAMLNWASWMRHSQPA